MEENMINKRKIAVFSAVAIIISYGINALLNVVTAQFTSSHQESMTSELYQLFTYCSGLVSGVLTLAVFLIVGYILTRDKRKTFIFAGSMYLGKQSVAIITSLISTVLHSLMYAGVLTSTDSSRAVFAADLLFVPLDIFVAYFIYTALEGVNRKFDGGLEKTEMTLPRARTRYIVYALIGSVVVGVLGTAPNLIISLVSLDTIGSVWITVISRLATWLSNTLSLAILFFAGYKAYNSVIDGMAFGVCSGVAGGMTGVITSLLYLPLVYGMNYYMSALESGINPMYMSYLSVGMGAFSVVSAVISFVGVCIMMKYFFPVMKVALFSEQTPVSEAPSISDVVSREEELASETVESDGVRLEREE